MQVQIAKLLNVTYDTDTGDVYLEMKVTDPVWRTRFLREWQNLEVKLVVEEKKEEK
jgi:hypothetical protein